MYLIVSTNLGTILEPDSHVEYDSFICMNLATHRQQRHTHTETHIDTLTQANSTDNLYEEKVC